jgi:hypothetical protein
MGRPLHAAHHFGELQIHPGNANGDSELIPYRSGFVEEVTHFIAIGSCCMQLQRLGETRTVASNASYPGRLGCNVPGAREVARMKASPPGCHEGTYTSDAEIDPGCGRRQFSSLLRLAWSDQADETRPDRDQDLEVLLRLGDPHRLLVARPRLGSVTAGRVDISQVGKRVCLHPGADSTKGCASFYQVGNRLLEVADKPFDLGAIRQGHRPPHLESGNVSEPQSNVELGESRTEVAFFEKVRAAIRPYPDCLHDIVTPLGMFESLYVMDVVEPTVPFLGGDHRQHGVSGG